MNVIFLDFDGVLNRGSGRGEPDLVARLNLITRVTGAYLVVHSSWRYGRTVQDLEEILRDWGVTGKVLDATPVPAGFSKRMSGIYIMDGGWDQFVEGFEKPHHERAISIQRYLNEHPEVTRFVILDDCPDMGHFVGTPMLVTTNINQGITEALMNQAIALLIE